MLNVDDIKKMDSKEIASKISAFRKDHFEQKMQKTTSGLEKPHKMKELKKDIARLMTVQQALKKSKES